MCSGVHENTSKLEEFIQQNQNPQSLAVVGRSGFSQASDDRAK